VQAILTSPGQHGTKRQSRPSCKNRVEPRGFEPPVEIGPEPALVNVDRSVCCGYVFAVLRNVTFARTSSRVTSDLVSPMYFRSFEKCGLGVACAADSSHTWSNDGGPQRAWSFAVGCPNQVVSASGSPGSVRSPTQATYPSGRTNTAVGAVTAPSIGSSHIPPYLASID
jgi:hypothetical protein